MQLVCFPFVDKDSVAARDCLVLPKLALFLQMQQTPPPGTGTAATFPAINRLLLALILLGTQPGGGLYKVGTTLRQKITLAGAVKKAALAPYIQTERERLQAELAASQQQLAGKDAERAASQQQLAGKDAELAASQQQLAGKDADLAASQQQLAEERAASQKQALASQRKLAEERAASQRNSSSWKRS